MTDQAVELRRCGGSVCLVVSNLEYGGAQRQVVALANQLLARGVDAHVVSLSSFVPLARGLDGADGRLHLVEKRHRADASVVWRLAALLRRLESVVTHAFLLDAEIAARLARVLYPRTVVIGSERNADYVPRRRQRWALRATDRFCDAVIANSNAGRRFRERVFGAAPGSVFVVHNGVDTNRFVPSDTTAARLRIGLPPASLVVGMFASFKTQKNHAMFFRMARGVLQQHADARFLCVGGALHQGLEGSAEYMHSMRRLVDELGLGEHVVFAGNQDELVPWYGACDVAVLTSAREGTPNVLLEAMACGIPVVATDVADNASIVPDGQAGYVVAYDDHEAMAARVSSLLSRPDERRRMGRAAREWVSGEFSQARLAEKTTAVYATVLERRRAGARR